MIFSSAKLRCARCRHRLNDGQGECEHCAWPMDVESAREMGRMVENFRRYYFWRRVKDFLLGKQSVFSPGISSRRRSTLAYRDREVAAESGSARAVKVRQRTWLGMQVTTALLLNLTASLLLAANVLDQSLIPRIAADDSALQGNPVVTQYGWPFVALATHREIIQRAAPNETLVPEWKRRWNYARLALNVLFGFVALAAIRFVSEHILLRGVASKRR